MSSKIKTLVVNLEKSKTRRKYMEELLAPYDFLDIEFIKAVDGRLLSFDEKADKFNMTKCVEIIGRKLNDGEIGCTLSHQKCYATISNNDYPYAIIFEDDITFINDFNTIRKINLDKILNTDVPTVLMLSGDYWYWRKKTVVSVLDCVGAYAYIINKAAANLLGSLKACGTADNWSYFMSHGLKIKAIYPYLVDANLNMDLLSSDVAQDEWIIHRDKMKLAYVIRGYLKGAVKRILKSSGHFESKVRIINNKIVDQL